MEQELKIEFIVNSTLIFSSFALNYAPKSSFQSEIPCPQVHFSAAQGDQPQAIEKLVQGINEAKKH